MKSRYICVILNVHIFFPYDIILKQCVYMHKSIKIAVALFKFSEFFKYYYSLDKKRFDLRYNASIFL